MRKIIYFFLIFFALVRMIVLIFVMYKETNKNKKTKIMESQEIKNARIEFSNEDINSLMESGYMAITDTVNGLLNCSYEFKGFHEFTFSNNDKEIKFSEIESAKVFLQFQYSVG